MSQKRAKRERKLQRLLVASNLGSLLPVLAVERTWTLNRRFSRIETPEHHIYIKSWGKPIGKSKFTGRFKCKLMHGQGWTVIAPDQIYLQTKSGWGWIQPMGFGPNLCVQMDAEAYCQLQIDISAGETLRVRFCGSPIRHYEDGAHLYECDVFGPPTLLDHCTEEATFTPDLVPYLRLHHHTTREALTKIQASRSLRTSACNIQGTTKRLVNVGFAYFTPLDAIKTNDDLKVIAMSSDSRIYLCRDGATVPEPLDPRDAADYPEDILVLEVYQGDTRKRNARISLWIDATMLAPQHIYRHDLGGPIFYEITHAFIQRVGMRPGSMLPFDDKSHAHRSAAVKHFDYIVVGDSTTLDGLAAPYNEENTLHLLKVERVTSGDSFANFWFASANSNLFSQKFPEMQQFSIQVS